jgi:hypothetical protein
LKFEETAFIESVLEEGVIILKQIFQTKKGKIGVIASLFLLSFSFFISAVAQGLIGDWATNVLRPMLLAILIFPLPLFITLISFSAAASGGYAYWRKYKMKHNELNSIIDLYEKLISIDNHTFIWMQQMKEARHNSVNDLDNVAKKAIEHLLYLATDMFNQDIDAGALFLEESNILKVWTHYRLSQTEVEDPRLRFDLSQVALPPIGMARASYCNKSIEYGYIEKRGDRWECTNSHYIKTGVVQGPLEPSGFPLPRYASMICVPVIHNTTQKLLGVITFQSHERAIFDNPDIHDLMKKIANRISEPLVFYQFLK